MSVKQYPACSENDINGRQKSLERVYHPVVYGKQLPHTHSDWPEPGVSAAYQPATEFA